MSKIRQAASEIRRSFRARKTASHRWVPRELPKRLPARGSVDWRVQVVRRVYATVRDDVAAPDEVLLKTCQVLDAILGRSPGESRKSADGALVRWLLARDGLLPLQERPERDMLTGGDL